MKSQAAEQIRRLLRDSKVEAAIDLLERSSSSAEVRDDSILWAGRLARIRRLQSHDAISESDANAELGRISEGVLSLLPPTDVGGRLDEAPEVLDAAPGTNTQGRGPLVFVSYAHEDEQWRERLAKVLKPLLRAGLLEVWSDKRIGVGEEWKTQISNALDDAVVAVLLVSEAFLASDFIHDDELPHILASRADGGLTIIWLCLRPCLWEHSPIAAFQAAHDVSAPLESLPKPEQDRQLVDIAEKIYAEFVARTT